MIASRTRTTYLGAAIASALSMGVVTNPAIADAVLPSGFEVETKDLSSITFKWDAKAESASSVIYQIGYDSVDDGLYEKFVQFPNVTTGTIVDLAPGKQYFFVLGGISVDGNQSVAWSEEVSVRVEADSDSDGLYDSRECTTLDPLICPDTDGDGIPNNLDSDDDGDGILTIDEGIQDDGSLLDTDSDSLPDYLEPNDVDTNANGASNNNDADDDGDTVSEPSLTTETEVDGQILFPPDTDGDGIHDYLDADSTNGAGTEDGSGDSDRDGKSDAEECSTPPFCTEDLDGDGLSDYLDNSDDRVVPAAVPDPAGPIVTGLDGAGGGSLGFFGLGVLALAGFSRRFSRKI